jgi:hypothetical protein
MNRNRYSAFSAIRDSGRLLSLLLGLLLLRGGLPGLIMR